MMQKLGNTLVKMVLLQGVGEHLSDVKFVQKNILSAGGGGGGGENPNERDGGGGGGSPNRRDEGGRRGGGGILGVALGASKEKESKLEASLLSKPSSVTKESKQALSYINSS